MIVVSYDISDDKLRTKFSKYLSKFGHRLQYSVFEIDNSNRILNNITSDLKIDLKNLLPSQTVLLFLKCRPVARCLDLVMQRMTKKIFS